MKKIYLILLPLIALVNGWVFYEKPWRIDGDFLQLEKDLRVELKVKPQSKSESEIDDFGELDTDLTEEEADKQWQRSLFNVSRKEQTLSTKLDEGKEPGKIDIGDYALELIGAGRYGNKYYASITIKAKRSTSSRTFRSSSSSRSRTSSSRTSAKPVATKRRDGQSNIIKKGEKVGETGYTLTQIHFVPRRKQVPEGDSTYVVLTKGSERIELHLDKGGKSSDGRKKALNEATLEPKVKTQKKDPAKVDLSKLTPPPPPPPPPGTTLPTPKNGGSTTTNSSMSIDKQVEFMRRQKAKRK